VYSLSYLSYPIATYPLGGWCCSGIIADNRLYLCGGKNLHIFEVTTSITQPLMPVKVIDTVYWVYKILRVGHKLLLGEGNGYFQVFDINTSAFTHTYEFKEGDNINDITTIDETHYLLAGLEGLLKTTKDQLIKNYYKGDAVTSLCHVTDSLYLVGFGGDGLILWNE
jgi:hypothetical protein